MGRKSTDDLQKILKKINLNKNILSNCIFINDFGGMSEENPNLKQAIFAKDWGLLCLIEDKINLSLRFPFPRYLLGTQLDKIINDMKIRQLLEYYKVYNIKFDNVTSILFNKDNLKDAFILDFLCDLRYNYNIVNPSKYNKIVKAQFKDQFILDRIHFTEWEFLYIYIQFKNEKNIIENIKRYTFQEYLKIKLDTPQVAKYFKEFGKTKDETLSSPELIINFLKFLYTKPFYIKSFSQMIDPVILNALQFYNNIDSNENFNKYYEKRKKESKPYKFNFKETFGKERLFNKEKIIDEIKKTRQILKLPRISYD